MTDRPSNINSATAVQIKVAALLAALVLHLTITVFLTPTGRINGDEGIYHMMFHALVHQGRLDIWNGLDELASKELIPLATRVVEGRLMPQYPHLFIFLGAPFYLLAGFKGLIYLNSAAFAGSVALVIALANRLFRDTNLSLNAALIFVFATFSWEYSQAAWPHSTALFLGLSGFYLGYLSLDEDRTRRTALLGVAAGLAFGLSIGVRLDSVFVMPAIIIAWLLRPRVRLLPIAGMLIGLMPFLLLLAYLNYLKFGSFVPFSYGVSSQNSVVSVERYLPLAGFGLLAALALWVITKPRFSTWLQNSWLLFSALSIVTFVAAIVLVPALGAKIGQLTLGLHALVVDMRVFPVETSWIRQSIFRSETGGMFTAFQGWKKALLQSMPYLVMLILPAHAIVLRRADRLSLTILFMAALSPIIVFSYLVWHGGSPLNMRYFLSTLPFAAILTAYAWRDLARGFARNIHVSHIAVGLLAYGTSSMLLMRLDRASWSEHVMYATPLAIATVLMATSIASLVARGKVRIWSRRATAILAVIAFVWSGSVTAVYDYRRAFYLRDRSMQLADLAEMQVTPNSLVFLPSYFPFSAYFEGERIRYAAPLYDDFQDVAVLIRASFDAGRKVYMWMDETAQVKIEERGLLKNLTKTSLGKFRETELLRLEPVSGRLLDPESDAQ